MPWITCNLPFHNNGCVDDANLPAPPDTSDQERAQFGTTHTEQTLTDDEQERLSTAVTPALYERITGEDWIAREKALATEAGLADLYQREQLKEEIHAWRQALPEWVAYLEHHDQEYERLQKEQDALSFSGRGLNVPGTVVEVEGKRYLIGHINVHGGVCDDCRAFEDTAIVTRYKVLEDLTQDVSNSTQNDITPEEAVALLAAVELPATVMETFLERGILILMGGAFQEEERGIVTYHDAFQVFRRSDESYDVVSFILSENEQLTVTKASLRDVVDYLILSYGN